MGKESGQTSADKVCQSIGAKCKMLCIDSIKATRLIDVQINLC